MFAHTLQWDHSGLVGSHGVKDLIEFPALLIAELALVMSAVRLLVMFFPKLRAKWGRFTKEKDLVYGLACAYILMEGALWSGVAAMGVSRYGKALSVGHSTTTCSQRWHGYSNVKTESY